MKLKSIVIVFCTLLLANISANAQFFELLKQEVKKQGLLNDSDLKFSKEEAAKAIKEALSKGITKGTDLVSKKDGFFKNPEIKIPFPEDAKKAEKTLRKIGMGKEVDKAVKTINHAAEEASKEAKEIFIDAIKQMTVKDAVNIVKGNDDSATRYLEKTSTDNLKSKFSPIIDKALNKVGATKHWKTIMTAYNKVPFVDKINPDLEEYVTNKALEGLFIMIAKEEKEIRKDPIARTTELLKKVFGNL